MVIKDWLRKSKGYDIKTKYVAVCTFNAKLALKCTITSKIITFEFWNICGIFGNMIYVMRYLNPTKHYKYVFFKL